MDVEGVGVGAGCEVPGRRGAGRGGGRWRARGRREVEEGGDVARRAEEGLFVGGDGWEIDFVVGDVGVGGGKEAEGAGVGAGAEGNDLAFLVVGGGREKVVDDVVYGCGAGVCSLGGC